MISTPLQYFCFLIQEKDGTLEVNIGHQAKALLKWFTEHFLFHIFCSLEIKTEWGDFRSVLFLNINYWCGEQKEKGKVSLNPIRYPSFLTCGMLLFAVEQVQKKKEDPCFSLWDQGLSKAQCRFYLFDLLKQGQYLLWSWKAPKVFSDILESEYPIRPVILLCSLHEVFLSQNPPLLEMQKQVPPSA